MLSKKLREQQDLFVACSLRDLVPEDHILRRVERVLDLSWLRDEVRELYCSDNGRPGIDPEVAVRLMLAGFFQGVVHDRKLLREAQVNIAIRWFCGFRLDEKLPDHSSLTRIRQRWGAERFKRIFQRTVELCVKQNLVSAETIHIDATLIRANASMESVSRAHADAVLRENTDSDDDSDPSGGKPVSRTDPDAALSKSSKQQPAEPRYKQHTAVDDKAQIIVDVSVTSGDAPEEHELIGQIERIERTLAVHVSQVTADRRYGIAANYHALEVRGTDAVIVPQTVYERGRSISKSEFKYDETTKSLQCPAGKWLHPKGRLGRETVYRSRSADCKKCPLRERCLSAKVKQRTVRIPDGYSALLRARLRHASRASPDRYTLGRHRYQVEGIHGEAKTQHGLRRAVRRRKWNVEIQVYLTAAVINLKRLAAARLTKTRIIRTAQIFAYKKNAA